MMREEFEKRTGIFVTSRMYQEIEKRYMEMDVDKDVFCKEYKANKNGIAESIQWKVDMEELDEKLNADKEARRISGEIEAVKESCRKQVEELRKKLDRELEWKPCKGGTTYDQGLYDDLARCSCTRELSDEDAKAIIYNEFGFAREKVKIIHEVSTYESNKYSQMRVADRFNRKPLYNATDWNYIRFDCAGWQYEMVNGGLNNYEN